MKRMSPEDAEDWIEPEPEGEDEDYLVADALTLHMHARSYFYWQELADELPVHSSLDLRTNVARSIQRQIALRLQQLLPEMRIDVHTYDDSELLYDSELPRGSYYQLISGIGMTAYHGGQCEGVEADWYQLRECYRQAEQWVLSSGARALIRAYRHYMLAEKE